MTSAGFPHSEIPESKSVSISSGLIAASYVLHRFLEPRHPPYTLNYLIKARDNESPIPIDKA